MTIEMTAKDREIDRLERALIRLRFARHIRVNDWTEPALQVGGSGSVWALHGATAATVPLSLKLAAEAVRDGALQHHVEGSAGLQFLRDAAGKSHGGAGETRADAYARHA